MNRILRYATLALVVIMAMSMFAACNWYDPFSPDRECTLNGEEIDCEERDRIMEEGSDSGQEETAENGGDTTTGTTQTTDENGTSTVFRSGSNQTTTTPSGDTQQDDNGTGIPFQSQIPNTGWMSNTNFIQGGTCGTTEDNGVVVMDTASCENGGAVNFQTGKTGQRNVRLVVHDDEQAVIDGYDVMGYPGVLKGLGPGTYEFTISDGAILVGQPGLVQQRYCQMHLKMDQNAELKLTVEPLDGWNCGS